MTGKIVDVALGMNGVPRVTLEINEKADFLAVVDDLMSMDKLSIDIKKYRKKRSLDANAYAWTLIGKIAEKMNITTEEVYREHIRNIGNYEIVCVKKDAAEKLRQGWQKNGIGWITEQLPSKIAGCVNVMLFYGSSTYDTEQMSRLIDNIVQDCKSIGIETLTPDELLNIKSMWGDE